MQDLIHREGFGLDRKTRYTYIYTCIQLLLHVYICIFEFTSYQEAAKAPSSKRRGLHTHNMHQHIYTYIFIYIYTCIYILLYGSVCICHIYLFLCLQFNNICIYMRCIYIEMKKHHTHIYTNVYICDEYIYVCKKQLQKFIRISETSKIKLQNN